MAVIPGRDGFFQMLGCLALTLQLLLQCLHLLPQLLHQGVPLFQLIRQQHNLLVGSMGLLLQLLQLLNTTLCIALSKCQDGNGCVSKEDLCMLQ